MNETKAMNMTIETFSHLVGALTGWLSVTTAIILYWASDARDNISESHIIFFTSVGVTMVIFNTGGGLYTDEGDGLFRLVLYSTLILGQLTVADTTYKFAKNQSPLETITELIE